ncbi:glutamate decarboxylase [Pseudodesulfovibrio sp.]|uniref:glutamate decarboxylase n=1 Tax=Pseudodesulfovibrio sp. TaxID=2035812 RepID=UPI00261C48F8|nr:glutamate decarboxylase [Pseudodesulfovibrio sp.]MDD3312836.1 glutamate decarboxylase [Pseudodesulfovibrio sp.]
MALHEKDTIRHRLLDDVFAADDLSVRLPRYRFPDAESAPRHVYQVVHDELMLDGNARQNLATFCQTWAEPEVRRIMNECLDKNMIDKDEYPQTAELEARCVHMLADLWRAPDGRNSTGCSTTGSSEAAMLGGLALKWRWREKRRAAGLPTDRPNLVCGPVQVCWHKFARYWDVELREVPMARDRLILTPEEVVARCDENTIGVVPTLGVTFTCQYEPVAAICAALDELQARTGLDVPVHVDAASGGFVAPFAEPELDWDFRQARVVSINSSGHKYGLAPLGVGWVVWRDATHLPEDLVFRVNYLGGDMPTFALNFSRPGGQIAAQYYNFLRLGREGYRRIHQACRDTARELAGAIAGMGPFRVIHDGAGGLPAVSWSLAGDRDHGYTLYDLSDRLRTRGWQVAAYAMPPDREDLVVMRVLVRHGFSRDLGDLFASDLRRCLDYFGRNPVTVPLTEAEAGGYSHSK